MTNSIVEETNTEDMSTSSNLNLLRCGRHFGSIFVHYDGRHGGLANRNAFDKEHGCIELRRLCQRPAENVREKIKAKGCKLVQHEPEHAPTHVRETMEEAAFSFSFMNSK